ncbi:AI-2E family transporter [Paracoccus sp. S-4012]|uniref:AI-2E family transporter n=1 Tax=Paracoccus sp. S-4012 TaxID=2665648 RepID=UPI0012AFA3D1|nr:AI-2E family transporter [Paracoccus sp. S-4012]MRX51961.1 AI-2E family transporter [Paracoccus sp. S-4012]
MTEPRQTPERAAFPRLARDSARLKRFPRWPVIGIFLILAFQMVAEARAFLMPVTLAILLFFVFSPVRRLLRRLGLASGITAGLITLSLLVAVAVLGYLVSGPVTNVVQNSDEISARVEAAVHDLRSQFRGLEEAVSSIGLDGGGGGETTVSTSPDGTTTVQTGPAVAGTTTDATGAVVGGDAGQDITVTVDTAENGSVTGTLMTLGPEIAGQVAFTLILLFFLLDAGDLLYLKIVQSFGTMGEKRRAYMALREIEDSLGAYLGAITLINAILGAAFGLAMWAWGMPSPVLFGVGMFLANFVPYIGPTLVALVTALVALTVTGDMWSTVLIAGTSVMMNFVEGQFVTPYFLSRRLRINTVVVFTTVALWAWLWSVIGMIVAVPVLVVVRVLAGHIPGLEKFANFLAGEPPPALEEEEEETPPEKDLDGGAARVLVEAGDAEPDSGAAEERVAAVGRAVEEGGVPPQSRG